MEEEVGEVERGARRGVLVAVAVVTVVVVSEAEIMGTVFREVLTTHPFEYNEIAHASIKYLQ